MAVINKEVQYMALPLAIHRGNPFPSDDSEVWYDKSAMETYAQREENTMAVINKEVQYMALPLAIHRGNPFPSDDSEVWYDKSAMETYAQMSPVAYVGQFLVYVNEEGGTVEAYVIQNTAGALTKLAATTSSGDLTEDVLDLRGKVAALEAAVGSKGAESSIVATDLWSALEEIKKAYEAADQAINTDLDTNYYDKTATDAKIDEKIAASTTDLWSALEEIKKAYEAADQAINTDLDTNYYDKTATDAKIDEKIAASTTRVYKPSGSKAFEKLPALAAEELGKVYNVTNAFTTTENFLEGAGQKFPAGTNVACVDAGDGVYKWDALAGMVDLTGYVNNEKFATELDKKVDKVVGSSLVENTLIEKLRALADIKGVAEGELEIEAESGTLKVVAIDQSKISGLTEALQGKVDSTPGHSLVEDSLITKLTGMLEIKSVSEELEVTGDRILGVKAISQDKVTGLPDALKAKLNGVKIGDTPLTVGEDGVAAIPIATADAAGAVKGSVAENTVAISGDGTMTVNNINVNKLIQTENELLILDGGTSADPIV